MTNVCGLGWSMLAAVGMCCAANAAAVDSVLSTQVITEPVGGERVTNIATVDVTGIPSIDRIGSPLNAVLFVWIGAGNEITGVGWDVVLQTVAPDSWRDDMRISVTNSANDPSTGFGFRPGSGDGPGGPTSYSSGGIRSVPSSFPIVRARFDGLIRLEFAENYEDAPGEIDGLWVSGEVLLQTRFAIPAPVSAMLFGLSVGAALRRRRSS